MKITIELDAQSTGKHIKAVRALLEVLDGGIYPAQIISPLHAEVERAVIQQEVVGAVQTAIETVVAESAPTKTRKPRGKAAEKEEEVSPTHEAAAEETKEETAAGTKAGEYTSDQVRDMVSEFLLQTPEAEKAETRTKLKTKLTEFGVEKVTDLPEENRGEFITYLKSLR